MPIGFTDLEFFRALPPIGRQRAFPFQFSPCLVEFRRQRQGRVRVNARRVQDSQGLRPFLLRLFAGRPVVRRLFRRLPPFAAFRAPGFPLLKQRRVGDKLPRVAFLARQLVELAVFLAFGA